MYLKTVYNLDLRLFDGKVKEKKVPHGNLMLIYHGIIRKKKTPSTNPSIFGRFVYSMSLYIPNEREFLHQVLVGGPGYVPGVCWMILRMYDTVDVSEILHHLG